MASTPTVGRPKSNVTINGKSTRSRSYDPRGNSKDRRARKNWMLSDSKFSRRPGTEGHNVNCTHCGKELDYHTVESDKINPSGGYQRHNVQPACRTCNIRRSNDTTWKHESGEI